MRRGPAFGAVRDGLVLTGPTSAAAPQPPAMALRSPQASCWWFAPSAAVGRARSCRALGWAAGGADAGAVGRDPRPGGAAAAGEGGGGGLFGTRPARAGRQRRARRGDEHMITITGLTPVNAISESETGYGSCGDGHVISQLPHRAARQVGGELR